MALAHDITRCHDASCQSRERCRRWIERNTGHSNMAFSLREPGGYCLSYIHPGPAESRIELPDWVAPEQAADYRRAYLQGWIDCCNAREDGGDDD
jgi:hypothetical protein